MPEWLLAILVGGVIVGLAGLVWRAHEARDNERFKDIWDQIGRDSQSGMRKTCHDAYNLALGNRGLIERLEDQVKKRERNS